MILLPGSRHDIGTPKCTIFATNPSAGCAEMGFMLIRLIPKIFYDDLEQGLDLFAGCLGFEVLHRDGNLAVVARDGAKAYIVASPEYAAKDRPEIAIEVDNIRELYEEIKARRPEMLHPNLKSIRQQHWGSLEFAVADKTTVCVVFRQWPEQAS